MSVAKGSYGSITNGSGRKDDIDGDELILGIDHYDILEFLHRQEVLQDSLSKLASYIKPRANGTRDFQGAAEVEAVATLEKAQSSSVYIGSVSKVLAEKISADRSPPTCKSTAKAKKVFSMPELLEHILGYLSSREKLNAMRVQRTWFNTVNDSVILMRSLGLALRQDSFYSSPFFRTFTVNERRSSHLASEDILGYEPESIPGGNYYNTMLYQYGNEPFWRSAATPQRVIHQKAKVEIEVNHCSPSWSTRTGSRVKSMAICSPPIKALGVDVECLYCRQLRDANEDEDFIHHQETRHITSDSDLGFTVGDLENNTADIATEHPRCDMLSISYTGDISICGDDPLVKEQHRKIEAEEAEKAAVFEYLRPDYRYVPCRHDRLESGGGGRDYRVDRAEYLERIQDAESGDGDEDGSRIGEFGDRDAPACGTVGPTLNYDDEDIEMADGVDDYNFENEMEESDSDSECGDPDAPPSRWNRRFVLDYD